LTKVTDSLKVGTCFETVHIKTSAFKIQLHHFRIEYMNLCHKY